MALDELAKIHLLEKPLGKIARHQGLSRRQLMKVAGIAALIGDSGGHHDHRATAAQLDGPAGQVARPARNAAAVCANWVFASSGFVFDR